MKNTKEEELKKGSQVGRTYTANGTDLFDVTFHEKLMDFTPEAEEEALSRLDDF